MKTQLPIVIFALLALTTQLSAQQSETSTNLKTGLPGPEPVSLLVCSENGSPVASQELQVDELPRALKRVEPYYPELAKKAGIEGIVYVQLWVDTAGNVSEVKIWKSDHEVLNEAALQAARQWTFAPAMKDGKKIAIALTIPFRFKLSDKQRDKGMEEKTGYEMLNVVKSLLGGTANAEDRKRIIPEATFIDGNSEVNLMDAVLGRAKNDVFSAEQGRSIASIRLIMNDQKTAATVVAETVGKMKSARRWHTVVWMKTGDGEWKIQHWHASR